MSKQAESRLQLRIRHALELHFPGSWWMKVWGGPFQPAGVPDLIGVVYGRFAALEVKRSRKHTSLIQRRTLMRLRRAGAIVGVVRSVDEAIAQVRAGLDDDSRKA